MKTIQAAENLGELIALLQELERQHGSNVALGYSGEEAFRVDVSSTTQFNGSTKLTLNLHAM